MTFHELNLIAPLIRAVDDMGYTEPSPIQGAAIPPILAGRDLIGCAQTGTGKTAAFSIPMLQRLSERSTGGRRPIRCLILTPTRELAIQIDESIRNYGKYLPLRHTVIFGGVGQNPQVQALQRGVDILTATPGRLNDLCNQGFIDLKNVEFFVLDEADRMLDMGFIHDVRKVLARLPQKRQTLLFSATMPQEIEELAQKILQNPAFVEVTPVASTVDAIEQRLYKVDKGNKRQLLFQILEDKSLDSVLVFTNTKHGANRLARELDEKGFGAAAIHGNKSQTARVAALEAFKSGKIRLLVATDIAARGIDVSELSCVVNYELPNVPETYVHRIGRTGRAGREGVAISFCNYDELAYLKDIEKLIGKKVPVVEGHPWPMEIFEATPKKQRGPRPERQARPQNAKKQEAPKKQEPVKKPVEGKPSQKRQEQPKPAARKTREPKPSAPKKTPKAAASTAEPARFDDRPRRNPRSSSDSSLAYTDRTTAFLTARATARPTPSRQETPKQPDAPAAGATSQRRRRRGPRDGGQQEK